MNNARRPRKNTGFTADPSLMRLGKVQPTIAKGLGYSLLLLGCSLRLGAALYLLCAITWLPGYLHLSGLTKFVVVSGSPFVTYSIVRASSRMMQIGRRLRSEPLASTSQLHGRKFVLYLRSFEEDKRRGRLYERPPLSFGSILFSPLLSTLTYEEQMVAALQEIGPVVSVGLPGQRLPEVGAKRLYIKTSEWRSAVLDLMDQAYLVILAMGSSDGLAWELEQARQRLPPNRLVLLAPLFVQQKGRESAFNPIVNEFSLSAP